MCWKWVGANTCIIESMNKFIRELLMILILPAGVVLGAVWLVSDYSSSQNTDVVINVLMKCEVEYEKNPAKAYEGDDCARYKTYVDVGIEKWQGTFWHEIKVLTPEGEKYIVDIPCPVSVDGTSRLCTFENNLPEFGDSWPNF